MVNTKWDKYIHQRLKVQKDYINLFLQYFATPKHLKYAHDFVPNHIYQSTSFSNHENYTQRYEKERNLVTLLIRNLNWNIYAPYEKTDPGKLLKRFSQGTKTKHGFSPQEIIDIDFTRILRSEVLVLDYNLSSNGIGQEAQVAFFIPKIIYSRKRPSMLTEGLPGTLNIYYDNFNKLNKLLTEIFQRDSFKVAPFYVKNDCVYKGNTNLNKKYKKFLWSWR